MQFMYALPAGAGTVTFDRTSSDYRLLKAYQGTAALPVEHQTVRAPYQDGVTRLDTNATSRTVTLDIMIVGTSLTDLQTKIKALTVGLNPLAGQGYLYFTQEDGTSYYLKAIPNNTPALDASVRGLTYQKATLSFIAHDPFWYTSGTSTSLTLSISGHAFFPFYGVTQSATRPTKHIMGSASPRGTATNTGNWPTAINIIFYGEIVNPVLSNSTTGEYISLNGTIASGARIQMTTGYGNQTCRLYTSSVDTVGTNAFSYLNIGSTFFLLQPGSNELVLTYTTASSPASAVISWESKYTGV